MRIGLGVLYALSAFGWNAVAQDPACIDVNQTAMDFVAAGRLGDAESVLSAALASPASGSERVCDGQTLHNLATVVSLSERLAEAEILEKRSLRIFERACPPGDPRLLRPLLSLARIQFERREIARARETYQRLQSIPTERAVDRAMVHGLAAELLHIEGRYHEAEAEYLKAVDAWEESGHGETTAAAAVLDDLATLYLAEGRYREAGRTLDRSMAIVTRAKDAVAMDRIKLFNARAELHTRRGELREAEADLDAAISAAGRDARLDPAVLKSLLVAYARVLRKNRRRKEARSIEARAAALQAGDLSHGVVDISELLAKSRSDKK